MNIDKQEHKFPIHIHGMNILSIYMDILTVLIVQIHPFVSLTINQVTKTLI